MSFAGTLRGLVFKRPEFADSQDGSLDTPEARAPETEHASTPAPARKSDTENPYLTARRSWNEHVGGVVSSRQTWQVVGILGLLIGLSAIGGIIHIGAQSKFVPYVVEVDKLGQQLAVGVADRAARADERIIHSTVAQFVGDARLITPDIALQRKAVFRIYALLAPNDPATNKMNEWLNGTPESSPFKRAEKETVSIEVLSVLPQTPETWQVDWKETVRDRQGVAKQEPYRMRALVTVFQVPPTPQTTEQQIRNNPMGIYVRDFSWSKLL